MVSTLFALPGLHLSHRCCCPPSPPSRSTLSAQVQLSKCVSERDTAQYERQQYHRKVSSAEDAAREAAARAEAAEAARAASEQALAAARGQAVRDAADVAAARRDAEEARRQLRQQLDERRRLESSAGELQVGGGLGRGGFGGAG